VEPDGTAMTGRGDLHSRPTTDHAFYRWLLSDHLDARAERQWRRGTYLQSARQTAADIAGWAARVSAPDGHTQAATELAAAIGPRAAANATRAEIKSAEPDGLYVARLRAEFETHMHARPANRDSGYRYPAHLTGGPGAAGYPPPEPQPGGIEPGA
jgi:hypothetical protein